MISLGKSAKLAEKFISDNAPTILTGIGVVGVVATAYLTGKASFKAADVIREEETRRTMMNEPVLEAKDKVKLAWMHFLPAAGTTALTIGCVVCANRISVARAAAMATAYSLGEKRFKEYREKVAEKLGVSKEQAARDEIAQEQVSKTSQRDNLVIVSGDALCFDSYTGRYFKSSIESIKQAQNDMNYEMLHNEFASLNDFYRKIGLPTIKIGDEVGWTRDHLIEITYSTVLAENNEPCIVLNYAVLPVRGYDICAADR